MVVLKVRKIGDSLGVVLPEEVVRRLGAGDGGELLLIEGPNDSYRVTSPQAAHRQKLEKAEEIMRRYRNTLHELAK